MNPAMKQRLVGTLVLGSLALILIPLLLDGEGVERPPLSDSIPPAPVFDTTPLPEPERPEILADALAPATNSIEPEATLATDQVEAPASAELASADAATDEATAPTVATAEPMPAPQPQSISEPALDEAGLPEAWTVRLGSFANRANADALVTRLIAAGHKAYIRPVMSGQVTLSGVYVGPLATRNEAATLQEELKSRFQISDAIVQRFDMAQ